MVKISSPWMGVAATALATLSVASPVGEAQDRRSTFVEDGTAFTKFDHAATGASIKYVTNSGICETTPNVNQYSGYLSVGSNMNMWFWYFEARNNSAQAPLAIWLNGGPGCSSMIGLFQENGPCQFYNGASKPSLNPYSFNNFANMLYVDQPIGTGFSYGTDGATSTVTAAPYVWKLLQAFYAQFPKYKNRDFGLFTESYGGHYGPEFTYYFEQQNAAIAAGSITGERINLIALGINNGVMDSAIAEQAYVDFSYSNSYKPLITAAQHTQYQSAYNNQCLPAIEQCIKSGSNSDCVNADNTCYNTIEGPISQNSAVDFDVYDIREPSTDPYPPKTYSTYLSSSAVMSAIGAKATYTECANVPYNKISSTGDYVRSFLPQLSSVVQSGVQTTIWAGDADWICNWFGNQATAEAITYSGSSAFKSKALTSYTVAGTAGGTFKTQGNLSFLRVFGAGHEVPYYAPKVALQVFKQTMSKQPLSST